MLKTVLKWSLLGAGALVGLLALLYVVGRMIPGEHTTVRVAEFSAPQDSVLHTLADWENTPKWLKEVTTVRRLPDHDGHLTYEESGPEGACVLELLDTLPHGHVVTRFTVEGFMEGTWTFDITPTSPKSCTVKLSDRTTAHSAFFKLVGRVMGGSELEDYLRELGKRHGLTVRPRADH